MGILRKTIALTGWTGLGATAGYMFWTRKNRIADVPPTDYLFNHTLFARYNPYNAPVTQDVCLREVPLDKIRPELLEKDGKLVEAFCAGVWGGLGYALQRSYLENKYRADPYTRDHLWDRKDLMSSNYEVGTKITDHFQVLAKNPNSIILRAGDSPRVEEVREADGLFEVTAEIKEEEGVAQFGLKSIFFNSTITQQDKSEKRSAPMPLWVQWLHQQYDKVLMETAITNCTR